MTRNRSIPAQIAATAAAWIAGVVVAFPILWMALTSFKSEVEAINPSPHLLFAPTLDNYRAVLSDGDYLGAAWNSLVVAGASTAVALLVAIPAAWAMAFFPTSRTRGLLLWMLSTKMMPAAAILMPIYFILRDVRLLDTRLGLGILLATGALPLAVWMLVSYFRDLPREVLEAARIDGAGAFDEIVRVLAPMAAPAIASTYLLNFLLAWNESFWSLNVTSIDAAPLTAFIAAFSAPHGLFWAKLSAASSLAVGPALILGWLCQRQLVRGLTFGAMK